MAGTVASIRRRWVGLSPPAGDAADTNALDMMATSAASGGDRLVCDLAGRGRPMSADSRGQHAGWGHRERALEIRGGGNDDKRTSGRVARSSKLFRTPRPG